MRKILTIGLKDLQLIFRDRAALIMMLLAPYLLTLGLGFVTGAFNDDDDNGGLQNIPVQIVNLDAGDLGGNLVELFGSADLQPLIQLQTATDIDTGRALVDEDELAALVIIPADFSTLMIPDPDTGEVQDGLPIEIYRSPSRPISASVIESIVTQFVNQVDANAALITVTIDQLLASGQVEPAQLGTELQRLDLITNNGGSPTGDLIQIKQTVGAEQASADFNVLTVLVPGMALFFLMYTVTLGGRSILMEQLGGTLPRMQTTPTHSAEILGGKIIGVVLTGIAQVTILIVVSTVLYGIQWGDWLAVVLLVVSVAVAASGWGILFASAARMPEQITGIGTAVMLIFGAISGTFTQTNSAVLDQFGRITPNKWALDGFTELGLGNGLVDILPNIAALWVMAFILFAVSIVLFSRKLGN